MRKHPVLGVVVACALISVAWVYLFHDYIAGNRWTWAQFKLGILDTGTVILGKEGWLFSGGSQDDIDDYRGLANPGNKVARFKESQMKSNDVVRSLGGRYLYVICPVSETLYNELLPEEYQKVGDRRRATLALEAMQGSGVEMLYLTPEVIKAKPQRRVFYKYESHWNWFGAYVGSQAVISYLSQYYPALKGTLAHMSDYEMLSGPPVKNMWNNGLNAGDHFGVTLGVGQHHSDARLLGSRFDHRRQIPAVVPWTASRALREQELLIQIRHDHPLQPVPPGQGFLPVMMHPGARSATGPQSRLDSVHGE